jgi:rod shape-determining protein MreC
MSTRSSNNAPLTRGQLLALILVFIVTALALLTLDRRNLLGPLKGVVERPIFALSERFTSVGNGLRTFTSQFGNVGELRDENQRLQEENDRLRASDARVKELELENKQLTEQANFAVKFPEYKSVPARVIGRDPTLAQKVLVIDRGSNDGIKMGMPVVSPSFLVGLVTEVTPNQAKVRLIIDQNMQIGVLLQQERAAGIMYGRWQQGGRLTVQHIGRDANIAINAIVVTSNWTLHVPQGLPIGFVTKVTRDQQADSLTLEVAPYVNFDSLETVSIILTDEQTGQPGTP